MTERILFLTGHLARPRLERVLAQIQRPDFEWAIVDIGVKVAALMTQAIIARRLTRPVEASRVIVPGRCRADLTELSTEFGVRFERGPDELKDLPVFLGGRARAVDLSRHDMRIFAEIVDASAVVGRRDRCARARDGRFRRRRHRSRLSAGPAVSASRRQRPRRQGRRPARQRRLRRSRTNSGAARGPAPISC